MKESEPYRLELAKLAADFRSRSKRQAWREDSLSKAERSLFVGFLFVRKLIECKKVTDVCARSSAAVLRARISRRRVVSDFSRDDLLKDLDSAQWVPSKVDIRQLADKVIHTWWILPVQGESGGLSGFVFTTDRLRDSELWLVSSDDVATVFERCASQAVTRLHTRRGAHGNLTYWRAE